MRSAIAFHWLHYDCGEDILYNGTKFAEIFPIIPSIYRPIIRFYHRTQRPPQALYGPAMEKLNSIHKAVLGIIVPEISCEEVEKVFTSADIQKNALFQEDKVSFLIPQRSVVHFGKSVIHGI